jgi:hypothetical protein
MKFDGDLVTIYTESESEMEQIKNAGYKITEEGAGWFCEIDIAFLRRKGE